MPRRTSRYVGVPAGFWDLPTVKAAVNHRSYRGILLAALTTTGTSQVQLADACGITQSHLAKILKGDITPTKYATITGIEAALAMPNAVRAAFHAQAGTPPPADVMTRAGRTPGHDDDIAAAAPRPQAAGDDTADMQRRTILAAIASLAMSTSGAHPLREVAAAMGHSGETWREIAWELGFDYTTTDHATFSSNVGPDLAALQYQWQ